MKTLQTGPMTTLKQRATRFGIGLGLAATLALSAVMPALAATGSPAPAAGSVAVTSGDLTVSILANTTATFLNGASAVALDGTAKTATSSLAITLDDATGSGLGWQLQMTTTQFQGVGSTTHKLPATALSITGGSVAAVANTNSQDPTDGVTITSQPVPASSTSAFISAAANKGMGSYTVTPTLSVAIPASTYADTYTSDVTVTVASGPVQ